MAAAIRMGAHRSLRRTCSPCAWAAPTRRSPDWPCSRWPGRSAACGSAHEPWQGAAPAVQRPELLHVGEAHVVAEADQQPVVHGLPLKEALALEAGPGAAREHERDVGAVMVGAVPELRAP